ncbi:MAG: molybdenum cofactor biosynthesis protein MoaE [Alphaproteobacteria bacterium]
MGVRVQSEPFDLGVETAAMTKGRRDVGAVASFVGIARETNPDEGAEPVIAMTLEHYPGMTERQLEEVEAEARSRWPLLDCLIVHRHGRFEPGDPIVLVVTVSSHRAAAFDACAFLMDFLKTKAPFWKREETASGERWVNARASDNAAADRWQKEG